MRYINLRLLTYLLTDSDQVEYSDTSWEGVCFKRSSVQISLFVVSTATETVCCMGSRFGQIMCDWSRRFLQVDCHAVSSGCDWNPSCDCSPVVGEICSSECPSNPSKVLCLMISKSWLNVKYFVQLLLCFYHLFCLELERSLTNIHGHKHSTSGWFCYYWACSNFWARCDSIEPNSYGNVAGWVDGWLGGWLSVTAGIVSKRLNLS